MQVLPLQQPVVQVCAQPEQVPFAHVWPFGHCCPPEMTPAWHWYAPYVASWLQ